MAHRDSPTSTGPLPKKTNKFLWFCCHKNGRKCVLKNTHCSDPNHQHLYPVKMDLQRSHNLPNKVIISSLRWYENLPEKPSIICTLLCLWEQMLLRNIKTPVTSPGSTTCSSNISQTQRCCFMFFNVSLSVLSHLCCPLLISHLFRVARRVQTECRATLSLRSAEATHQFLWSAERSADLHYVFMFLLRGTSMKIF